MDPLEDRAFIVLQKMLSFIGVWYRQPYMERLLRYYIIGSIFVLAITLQLCRIVMVDFNLKTLLMLLQVTIPLLVMSSTYFTVIRHYATLQILYNYVIEDWCLLKEDVEAKIIRAHAYRSKIFFLTFTLIFTSFICFFVLFLLYGIQSMRKDTETDILFKVESCIDNFINTQKYYYHVATYRLLEIFLLITATLACYSLYFAFIQHICARFCIIIEKIRSPFKNNRSTDNVDENPKDFSYWIIDIVQYLARTVEYVNLINSLSQDCNLFQVSLSTAFLTVNIVKVSGSIGNEENKNVPLLIIFIIGNIFPLYVNCHLGQKLMDYSVEVYKEICLVPIYEISLETQKLLLTTLVLMTKPCSISVGKMFVWSHEFFSNLLRTSLSYAMILHSLQTI